MRPACRSQPNGHCPNRRGPPARPLPLFAPLRAAQTPKRKNTKGANRLNRKSRAVFPTTRSGQGVSLAAREPEDRWPDQAQYCTLQTWETRQASGESAKLLTALLLLLNSWAHCSSSACPFIVFRSCNGSSVGKPVAPRPQQVRSCGNIPEVRHRRVARHLMRRDAVRRLKPAATSFLFGSVAPSRSVY